MARWFSETTPVVIHRLRSNAGALMAVVIEHRRGLPEHWVSATLADPADGSIATGDEQHFDGLVDALAWLTDRLGVEGAAA